MTCIPDPGITYESLLPYERERLAREVVRQGLDLDGMRDLRRSIEEHWEELTRLNPGLQAFADSVAKRATPGTVRHNRLFVGEFPDLPDDPFAWSASWLIFDAFECITDHAAIVALIAVLEHGAEPVKLKTRTSP